MELWLLIPFWRFWILCITILPIKYVLYKANEVIEELVKAAANPLQTRFFSCTMIPLPLTQSRKTGRATIDLGKEEN